MDIEIKPSKKYYIIPLLFLSIGGYFLFFSLTNVISSFSNNMISIIPDQSITIDVLEGEEYYIMIDVFSRRNTIFFQEDDYSSIQISNSYNNYTIEFSIYEEGNPNNFILAEEMPSNTTMSINDYEAIMTITFEEAGTYLIETNIIETEFPDFTFAVTNTNVFHLVGSIFLTILLALVTFGGTGISASIIYSKRAKAIRKFNNQYSYTAQSNYETFENY